MSNNTKTFETQIAELLHTPAIETSQKLQLALLLQNATNQILATIAQTVNPKTLINEHATLTGELLQAITDNATFVVSAAHGAFLSSGNKTIGADPGIWISQNTGMSLNTISRIKRATKFFHQPSAITAPPEKKFNSIAAKTAWQSAKQKHLRQFATDNHISLEYLLTGAEQCQYVSVQNKHQNLAIFKKALADTEGNRVSVDKFRLNIAKLRKIVDQEVDNHNRPRSSYLKFSQPDAYNMIAFKGRCNRFEANNIMLALQPLMHPEALTVIPDGTSVDTNRTYSQRCFDAIYTAVISNTHPTSPQPNKNRTLAYRPMAIFYVHETDLISVASGKETLLESSHGNKTTWNAITRIGEQVTSLFALLKENGSLEIYGTKNQHNNRRANWIQRLQVALQTPYCVYPGCEIKALQSDYHHVQAWSKGGKTTTNNIVPLCRKHHKLNDDTQTIVGHGHVAYDKNGIPGWRELPSNQDSSTTTTLQRQQIEKIPLKYNEKNLAHLLALNDRLQPPQQQQQSNTAKQRHIATTNQFI